MNLRGEALFTKITGSLQKKQTFRKETEICKVF